MKMKVIKPDLKITQKVTEPKIIVDELEPQDMMACKLLYMCKYLISTTTCNRVNSAHYIHCM